MMILRRLTNAIRKQDWFTVAVEILIVVFGVVIALQVDNWNKARQDNVAYKQTLGRLGDEMRANLDNSNALYELFVPRMAAVREAIVDLRACDTSDAAELRINAALNASINTLAVEWQFEAIDKLVSDPGLLSQQSQADQKELATIRRLSRQRARYIELVGNVLNENGWVDEPLSIGRGDLPVFDMSSNAEMLPSESYYREQKLGVSLGEACKDRRLMARLYAWEDSTTFMMLTIRQNKQDIEKWLADLGI